MGLIIVGLFNSRKLTPFVRNRHRRYVCYDMTLDYAYELLVKREAQLSLE